MPPFLQVQVLLQLTPHKPSGQDRWQRVPVGDSSRVCLAGPPSVPGGSSGHISYGCIPQSTVGLGPQIAHPSSQPGTDSVHEQGHSHQSGHSHSDWHSLLQTSPSWRRSGEQVGQSARGCHVLPPPGRQAVQHSPDRAAGSGPHATQGCRYKLQFGGCRLPHGHTGSWHCNRSPRFQVGRAQSSYHAANLEEGPGR